METRYYTQSEWIAAGNNPADFREGIVFVQTDPNPLNTPYVEKTSQFDERESESETAISRPVATDKSDPLALALAQSRAAPEPVIRIAETTPGPGVYQLHYVNGGTEFTESFDLIPNAINRINALKNAGIDAAFRTVE